MPSDEFLDTDPGFIYMNLHRKFMPATALPGKTVRCRIQPDPVLHSEYNDTHTPVQSLDRPYGPGRVLRKLRAARPAGIPGVPRGCRRPARPSWRGSRSLLRGTALRHPFRHADRRGPPALPGCGVPATRHGEIQTGLAGGLRRAGDPGAGGGGCLDRRGLPGRERPGATARPAGNHRARDQAPDT